MYTWSPRENLHSERVCDRRDALSDTPASDQSEYVSGKLGVPHKVVSVARNSRPSAFFYNVRNSVEIRVERDQKLDRQLSHRRRRIVGDVHDLNAAFFAGCDVDHVVPRAERGDVFYRRAGVEKRGRDLRAVRENNLGVFTLFGAIGVRRFVVNENLAVLFEKLPRKVARIHREAVKDNNLHIFSLHK